MYLAMIVAAFLMLLQVFTLFELLGDILRNQISPLVVGEYLLNVAPLFLYNIAPLSILLAVLVTLGVMQRSNEITAIKATGISIYRVIVPITGGAATMLAAGLFFFDQFYLPHANKRQDALRNLIKGKPAQTYLNPDRKWIFGQHSDHLLLPVFDSDRDQFGSLSVFQFDPATFQLTIAGLRRPRALGRTPAALGLHPGLGARACAAPPSQSYRTFDVATFAAISEPPTYFKKEVQAVFGDELRGAAPLHPRSAAERLRRGPAQGPVAEEIAFPINYAGHGGAGDSVFAGRGKARRGHGRCHGGGHRGCCTIGGRAFRNRWETSASCRRCWRPGRRI